MVSTPRRTASLPPDRPRPAPRINNAAERRACPSCRWRQSSRTPLLPNLIRQHRIVNDDAQIERCCEKCGLARHVARFRLHDVEIDVLKILYEALIDRDQRHGLGEYYTPDWLAAKVVSAEVDKQLEQH